MRHTIEAEELSGVFEVIIASSSKERKRLVMQTDIAGGNADTAFVVTVSGEEVGSYDYLQSAIEKYNSINP